MSRYSQDDCLTPEQWEAYLQPLAAENAHWHQHLEYCDSCRNTLNWLAGEPTWWEESEQWLGAQTEPGIQRFVAAVTQSVCALSLDGGEGDRHDPLCEFEIKQLQHMLAPASHPELLGRIGRYELEQLVGRGGMGLVFRARDVELHRIVAVKTLAVHLIPMAAARERFIREARASAGLVHPHIVPVYDVLTEGSIPALVMQFVAGPTLEAWLRTHGGIPWRNVLQIAIQLADALSAAHSSGLVHRDVKPGNVLLEADGSRALLSDFGLVRTLDDATLTRSGMLTGTPDYMSPEQTRGEAVLQSSDLFSLGSLLYAMLTGHPPFRASDPMAVMNRICHERHQSLSATHPEIPVEVSRTIDKLLSKDPRRRYPSAAELREHLQQLAQSPLHLRRSSALSGTSRWLALTCVVLLLVSALALLVRNRESPRESLAGEAMDAVELQAARDPSSAANSGFADLRALDLSIRQLDRRASRLQAELEIPTASPSAQVNAEEQNKYPTHFIDQSLQHIETSIEKLENEMSSTNITQK